MRRLVRWIVGSIAVVAGLLGLAALGAILYLRSPAGEAWLRMRLVEALEDAGVRGTVARVDGALPGEVRLHGVQVSFGGPSVVRADRVRVVWTPWALVQGQIRVRTLELTRPRVRLVRRDGAWGTPVGEGRGPGPRVRIDRLQVVGGRLAVDIDDDGDPTRVVLRDVALDAGLAMGWRGTRVDVRELRGRVAGHSAPPLSARGGIDVGPTETRADIQLATPESTLALAAALGQDDTLRVAVTAPRLAAAELVRVVPGLDLPGDVAMALEAAGPLEALEATVSIDVGDAIALRGAGTLDAGVWPPRAALDLAGSRVEVEPVGVVDVESLVVDGGGESLEATVAGVLRAGDGRVTLDGRVRQTTDGMLDLRMDVAAGDIEPWTGVAGVVRAAVRLRGSDLRVEVTEARTALAFGSATVTADLDARTARVVSLMRAADVPDRTARIDARMTGLGEAWRAHGTIEVADPVHGTVRAVAIVRPSAAGVVATIDTLVVTPIGARPWRLAAPARLDWDGALAVDRVVLVRGPSRVVLEGRVDPGGGPSALDLTIAAESIDLAELDDYVPAGIESVTGRLDATLQVVGPLDGPAIDGEGAVLSATMRVPGLGTLQEVDVRLRVRSGDALAIESLDARLGTGRITGTGALALTGTDDAGLSAELTLRRIPFARRPLYEGIVAGTVTVDGTVGAPRLLADLRVRDTVLRPRLLPAEGGGLGADPSIEVVGDPEAEPEPSVVDALSPIAMRVSVTIGERVRIERRDAAIRLAGRILIEKDPGGPLRLTGPVELPSGWYEFRGRRFDIRRGTIRFTGGPEIDPELRIRARHRTPGYLVWVEIGGTASAPALALSSEPSLSEADVLAVLLFGRPAGELRDDEQGVVQREARSVAFSYVAPALEESARRVLPVDRLEVSGEEVRVARQVTEDVFVSLSQDLTERGGQTVAMEYDLTLRTFLKLSTSSRGSSAIDFLWRRRY